VVVSIVQAPRLQIDRSRKSEQGEYRERSHQAAVSRAKRELRRFCTNHRLFFMWTLTYANGGRWDEPRLHREVERFVAKVVAARGGERFPYAFVVEHHKSGALHVHMAVPFFIKHKRLETLWGRGWVWIRDKRKRGECAHVGAVRAAGYLTSYVKKEFEESPYGRRRYEVARGFKVLRYQVRRRDLDDGQRYAEAVFLGKPEHVWHSRDCVDFAGPPTRVLFFGPSVRDG
jgi:hypothetical protein